MKEGTIYSGMRPSSAGRRPPSPLVPGSSGIIDGEAGDGVDLALDQTPFHTRYMAGGELEMACRWGNMPP